MMPLASKPGVVPPAAPTKIVRTTWPRERREELEARWQAGESKLDIRLAMDLTPGQLAGRITKWNLHTRRMKPLRNHKPDNPAMIEGRTMFPRQVTDDGMILKPGAYQSKLGGRVTKGVWRGMPIYAITLEERKTCPRECKLWVSCYGNGMQFAKRMRHGADFELNLFAELRRLQRKHRRGFVVRLHILGDFYSVDYVKFWRDALDVFPMMRVFGYTARQKSDPIGRAIAAVRDRHWDRFAIRTSGASTGPRTIVIKNETDAGDAIICPAQTNATRSCATCSLCWASKKPVAFLQH